MRMIPLDTSILSNIYGNDIPSVCKEEDIVRSILADDLKKSLRTGLISRVLFEQLLNLPGIGMRVTHQWITDEIRNLEFDLPCKTKQEAEFRGPALKNLYHKHFFIPFLHMPKNVLNCVNGKKFAQIVQKYSCNLENNSSPKQLFQYCGDIAQKLIDTSLKQETGDWLIYTRYNKRNYYLCIYPHPQGDSDDYKIKEFCQIAAQFFPELNNLLA